MSGPHPSHVTRIAMGASTYDEICENCGATDSTGGGWGRLADPCPSRPAEPVDPRAVAALHDALQNWLKRDHPDRNNLEVIAALSYELGRLLAWSAERANATDEDIRAALDGVRDVLIDHIAAYRRGLRH